MIATATVQVPESVPETPETEQQQVERSFKENEEIEKQIVNEIIN